MGKVKSGIAAKVIPNSKKVATVRDRINFQKDRKRSPLKTLIFLKTKNQKLTLT